MQPNQPNQAKPPKSPRDQPSQYQPSYPEGPFNRGPSGRSAILSENSSPARSLSNATHQGPSNVMQNTYPGLNPAQNPAQVSNPSSGANPSQVPGQTPHYMYNRYPYLNSAPMSSQQMSQLPPVMYAQPSVPVMGFGPHPGAPGLSQPPHIPPSRTPTQRPNAHRVFPDPRLGGTTAVPADTLSASSNSHNSNEFLTGSEKGGHMPVQTFQPPSVRPDSARVNTMSPATADSRPKQPSTRKRSSTACDKCRQKKIKCDNVKPQCGACKRNGIKDCQYSSENAGSDAWLSEMGYSVLMSKLDDIMKEVKASKEPDSSTECSSKRRKTQVVKTPHIRHWDASFTTFIRWPYFQKVMGVTSDVADHHIERILSCCDIPNVPRLGFGSLEEQIEAAQKVDVDFHSNFSTHLNAFLINSHTKVPFLNIVKLIESLEVFSLIKKTDDSVTISRLLKEYNSLKPTEHAGPYFLNALKKLRKPNSNVLQNAYRAFCESVPLILMVCANGIISAPVSLDNIGTYENSLEERASMASHQNSRSSSSPSEPNNRFVMSQMYVSYAALISATFPRSVGSYTTMAVKYHILLSQYYLYTLNPSLAHEEIINASNNLVFLLEKSRMRSNLRGPDNFGAQHDEALVNRLYWTCLKLECELRVELSPYVPLSSITDTMPPSSFFRIPEPVEEGDYTIESVRIADKYDDQNTWYFFLTEIAVRKIDNNMLDDVYRVWSDEFSWNGQDFANHKVWKLTIKYSSQLNSVVDSLTPAIRKFVLMESDSTKVYTAIKRKSNRRKKADDGDDQFPQILDDYLVDEDLLHHAQSEAVMFIKTRILSSKMILMRPLAYMCLHDQISFEEIVEAAMGVLAQTLSSGSNPSCSENMDPGVGSSDSVSAESGSERSIYQSAAALNFLDCDEDDYGMERPVQTSRSSAYGRSSLEDLSDLMDYAESTGTHEYSDDYLNVRKRVIKWFVAGLIAAPKLDIPKLGSFRHPGSWYYIRNLILGVMSVFLIYRKTRDYVQVLSSDTTSNESSAFRLQSIGILSQLFKEEEVRALLEHALLIMEYWKDERKDCVIYGDYLRQCLDSL